MKVCIERALIEIQLRKIKNGTVLKRQQLQLVTKA